MEEYLIHDNGGRPYKVTFSENQVIVYGFNGDKYQDTMDELYKQNISNSQQKEIEYSCYYETPLLIIKYVTHFFDW